jgi:hypothetical protein
MTLVRVRIFTIVQAGRDVACFSEMRKPVEVSPWARVVGGRMGTTFVAAVLG